MMRFVFMFLKRSVVLLSSQLDPSKKGTNTALLMPLKMTIRTINLKHSSFILHTIASNCTAYLFHVIGLKYII